jgi:hypothetical protein
MMRLTTARFLTIAVALSAGGCGAVSHCGFAFEKDHSPPGSPEASPTPDVQIDPSVQPTATEFSRRLTQHDGRLVALSSRADTLNARWTSGRCDDFEPAYSPADPQSWLLRKPANSGPGADWFWICGAKRPVHGLVPARGSAAEPAF